VSPGEAMQFIKAANLGRRAYATIHGGTEQQALGRLETLALGAQPSLGLAAVRRMAADGMNLLVRMGRKAHRNGVHRFVSRVSRVVGVDASGDYILETLYDSGADAVRDLYLPAVAHIAKGAHV
jgi:Flp pilus assembly CpaF family ATPase